MARRSPWEAVFWTPEPLWAGQTAFLLGGGPSLAKVDLRRLSGHSVMAINSSAKPAMAAGLDEDGVLFFMDNGWWRDHRSLCEAWRGPVVTLSRAAKREAPELVRRLDTTTPQPAFPPAGAPAVRWGRSSGHLAISLAIAMGAARIVLLGYDMRLVDGRSHHHDDYSRRTHPDVFADFLAHFEGWDGEAKAAGVEILNATPDSALTEFPMVAPADILPARQYGKRRAHRPAPNRQRRVAPAV